MTNIPVAPGELVDVGYLNEVARAHYRKTTSKQVLNSVVETDLLNGEITIGAGAMGTSRAIRLTARGDWIQNSAAARDVPIFKLKLGATTLLASAVLGATVAAASAARAFWRIDATIANLGVANSQWTHLSGALAINTGASVFGGVAFATGAGTVQTLLRSTTQTSLVSYEAENASAVDTTVAQLLALTVTLPVATATIDVTLQHALVELV